MENLLRDGDYVPNGFGGFTRLSGTQALLARALFKLTCRRGALPFLPELGSRLYELGREKPAGRQALARQYCAQTLSGMGLEIESVKLTEPAQGHARVEVWMTAQQAHEMLEVEI